jgi:hypothetical protein
MPLQNVRDLILQIERLRATANILEALYVRGRGPTEDLCADARTEIKQYLECLDEGLKQVPWADSCRG